MATPLQHQFPLKEYQRRRQRCLLILVTYAPAVGIIGYPLSKVFGSNVVYGVVASVWMAAFVVACVRLYSFQCPRCRYPFLNRGGQGNPLDEKCERCGFPKWGETDNDTNAA
ncbi:MAG TPA: hypothetical protein VEC99_16905 [Clostridia bacterium]|nr:hypothetical protein [Clostridia bacterium]